MPRANRVTHIPLVLTLLCLASTPSLALESARNQLTVEHPVGSGGVIVENLLGSVRVVAAPDSSTVRVDLQIEAEAKTAEEARTLAQSVRIEKHPEGDAMRFHVAFPLDRSDTFRMPKAGLRGRVDRWTAPIYRKGSQVEYSGRPVQIVSGRKGTGLAVHVTVAMPFDSAVSVRQSVGTIEGRALRGRLHLESADADIDFERCLGVLETRTVGGEVRVTQFQGERLEVDTTEGDVHLNDVRAKRARVHTVAGAIRGERVTVDRLEIVSTSGNVEMTGVEPRAIEVRTESGKVDLASHLKSLRDASIRTATGNISLRVGELTHFDLHAETKSGEVKSLGMSLDLIERDGRSAQWRHGVGGAPLYVSALGGAVTVRPYGVSRMQLLVRDR